jgi:hypothetical protein
MLKLIPRSYPQVINRLKFWGRRAEPRAHSSSIHGSAVRSDPNAGPVGIARSVGSVLVAVLCLIPSVSEASSNQVIKAQTYAASLLTPLEFSSALVLWEKESNWNTKARNGSHHGICQGRSEFLKNRSYQIQILWCIKYARSRYGSITEALEFWKVHKWH